MRQFNITFPNINGHIEVVYNNDLLDVINFQNCSLTPEGKIKFKEQLPVHLNLLSTAFKKATIVEAEVAVTFEMFWNVYNKKINKIRCTPLWGKLSKTEQIAAFMGVKKYDRYLQRENWRTKADPENYLRNRMWENEWR